MAKHEFHTLGECPAHIAWMRGGEDHCPMISVGALLTRREFNNLGYTDTGPQHARVNDEHCGDEISGTVVLDSASNARGFVDYGIFRRTNSARTPWVEIKSSKGA